MSLIQNLFFYCYFILKSMEKHLKILFRSKWMSVSKFRIWMMFFHLPTPLALEQVQNNCLCTLLQILHNFKHTSKGSCKLHSENIAHLCLQHYKQWQDVLNNLFSQIRLTSSRSTICSLTPEGRKKSVFSVLLQDLVLALDIHRLCHHEGCSALSELL